MSTTSTPPPASPATLPRWAWALIFLLVGAVVGIAAALLFHAAGSNVPASILGGGSAFAGTVILQVTIAHFTSAK